MTGVVTRDVGIAPDPTAGTPARPAAKPRRLLRPPSLDTLFTLLFAVGGWCVGLRRLGDNSFLWHWRTGHFILDHGIPHADIYSFTAPGAKWIAQSWLAELSYAVADKLAGGFGIQLLIAITGATLTALLFRTALLTAKDRVRAATLATLAFASIITVWSERPLLFGLVGMAALVYIVEFPESWAGRHALVTIPVTMWLWANVHGTFSLGYVFLALHLAGRWADGAPFWKDRERKLVVASCASAAAVAINPYGISLLLFPLDLVQRGSVLDHVVEWNSPNFRHLGGMLFALWLFTVVTLLARRKPNRRDVIVALPFLFLGLWALRNVGLTTIVTVPIAGRLWACERRRSDDRSPIAWGFVVGLVLLAFTWASSAASAPTFALSKYPVTALHKVHDDGLMGRHLFTTDAWAGYVIAKYWPEQRVFMDDRYDMYPMSVINDYNAIAGVAPQWQQALDRNGVNVVVWPANRSLTQALAVSPVWTKIYADKTAVVFVRASSRR
jgi:hypothetical protein